MKVPLFEKKVSTKFGHRPSQCSGKQMTSSELRSMTAISLGESWEETIEQSRCMIRAFHGTGIL